MPMPILDFDIFRSVYMWASWSILFCVVYVAEILKAPEGQNGDADEICLNEVRLVLLKIGSLLSIFSLDFCLGRLLGLARCTRSPIRLLHACVTFTLLGTQDWYYQDPAHWNPEEVSLKILNV